MKNDSNNGCANHSKLRYFLHILVLISGFTIGYFFRSVALQSQTFDYSATTTLIPMEKFPEPQWRTPATLAIHTVTSTPFARFEVHTVRTESGEVIHDWLWTDERSHVNILVHLKDDDRYLLFFQQKYGLEKKYLAPIGGLFNEGETALQCAHRELLEETGLETEELVDLGRYRVQVNRGGGILYAFLARNCVPSARRKKSDDYEKQEVRKLSRAGLLEATLSGQVGEAQWVATVALGLLYEEHNEHHKQLAQQ